MTDHQKSRKQLNKLFVLDATASLFLGGMALLAPHSFVAAISGGYNHNTHEALRLYGCLRVAVGWILFNARSVDDGKFRRSLCEALCVCYMLQSLAVLRAQFTDRSGHWMNWLAIAFFITFGYMYGRFRFGKNGALIKIYELPSTAARSLR
mmetsp:Transcript_9598/g.18033  ORF Transcript_9598/g.18033 Transcript_9598/m.18033 type:complete len:151 (-) Transcript_9598:2902-3354(-)